MHATKRWGQREAVRDHFFRKHNPDTCEGGLELGLESGFARVGSEQGRVRVKVRVRVRVRS